MSAEPHAQPSPLWSRLPPAPSRLSRRAFLGLAAAGLLAGCAPARVSGSFTTSVRVTPTSPPPTPIPPATPITLANAGTISQLAVLGPEGGPIRGIAWSPDRHTLAAGSIADIYLWDATRGTLTDTWHGHNGQIYTLAWSSQTKVLASASGDGTLRLWSPQHPGTSTVLRETGVTPLSVDWSPDGKRLVSGTFEGPVLIWDASTGKRIARWSGPPMRGNGMGGRYPFAVYGVSWSPDGSKILTTRYDGYIQIWDVASGQDTILRKTDSQPNTVSWSPDGARFAVTDDAGNVDIWNAATHAKTVTCDAKDSGGWAYAVKWSPDSKMLVVSRATGPVQVWDTQRGRLLKDLEGHTAPVWGVAWSSDGLRIASGSDDGTVRFWGVR